MSEKKFHNKEVYNTILFESDNFLVIPSLGAIVEGWLLIIPKEHFISMGYIDNENMLSELEELIEKVGDLVQSTHGDYVIFENGAYSQNNLVGCGVDYAHVHVVPTEHNLIHEIESKFNVFYNWTSVKNLKDTCKFIRQSKPYLYYRDQSKKSFVTTNENIPSQLFRRAIASSIGIDDKYDWKKYPFTDNIVKTINSYKLEIVY